MEDTLAVTVGPDASRVLNTRYAIPEVQRPCRFLGVCTFNHHFNDWSDAGSAINGSVSLFDGALGPIKYRWGVGLWYPQGESITFDSIYIRFDRGMYWSSNLTRLATGTLFTVFYS